MTVAVETFSFLPTLGFEPLNSEHSDKLVLDLGVFNLLATRCVDRFYQEVVEFSGLLVTPRTLGEVHFEVPRYVSSREQCIAFIAYFLRNEIGRSIIIGQKTRWLEDGLTLEHLLPWKIDSARYQARPRCFVDRPWMKVALTELATRLKTAEASSQVIFSFDGKVLSILVGTEVIAMPAKGDAWDSEFFVSPENIIDLPKRLIGNQIEVSIYEEFLTIQRFKCLGVATTTTRERTSKSGEGSWNLRKR